MSERERELRWQRQIIEAARRGDVESGWLVARALLVELDVTQGNPRSLSLFADFVERLLDIRDTAWQRHQTATRKQLAAAFHRLRITRRAGQRSPDETVWDGLSATAHELRRDDVPVLCHAADFVDALLVVKEKASNGMPTLEQLAGALDHLRIIKHGRAKTSDDELVGRLALEKIETKKAGSVTGGRSRLKHGPHALGEMRLRDIRTAHPDLAKIVDAIEYDDVLEGLADNLLREI